ncbi:hypothetical protein HDU99_004403, partial [Rhizoclosmatium hyalinum]
MQVYSLLALVAIAVAVPAPVPAPGDATATTTVNNAAKPTAAANAPASTTGAAAQIVGTTAAVTSTTSADSFLNGVLGPIVSIGSGLLGGNGGLLGGVATTASPLPTVRPNSQNSGGMSVTVGVLGNNEAKRIHLIAPIIWVVVSLLDGVTVDVERTICGWRIKANGKFKFMLERQNKRICIVAAKKQDLDQGLAQNLVGCEVVSDLDDTHE